MRELANKADIKPHRKTKIRIVIYVDWCLCLFLLEFPIVIEILGGAKNVTYQTKSGSGANQDSQGFLVHSRFSNK